MLRVEDVALGCAASLVAGVLFWPRGAAAALGAAYAEAYRASARLPAASRSTSLTGASAAARRRRAPIATAAGIRLDDALRQYLAEQGAKHVPLESVTALANGATRLRLAGAAIAACTGAPRTASSRRTTTGSTARRRADAPRRRGHRLVHRAGREASG